MAKANDSSGVRQVRDGANQIKEGLRDAASEQYENLRDQAKEYFDQGKDRAQEWEHTLEEYVQEKPIQSLLIAAGAGMLLGLLWRRH